MTTSRLGLVAVLGSLLLSGAACSARPDAGSATAVDASPGDARAGRVTQVIAISVDGLHPRALGVLRPAQLPAFSRLTRQGASTHNARTVVEETLTLPNHTSMVTGRRVAQPGGTGVDFNEDPGTTVHDSAGEYVPSVFDVVHDTGRRTGLFATKTKFAFLDRSWNGVNGAPDLTGPADGRDKIDVCRLGTSRQATGRLLSHLRGDHPPAFALLHLASPDAAGHAEGWLSAAYLRAVQDADAQVGRVLRAVAHSSALRSSTAVILTSDHGGRGTDHGDTTLRSSYRVPFFVWGTGVRADADLYRLNRDDRRDPGRTQPAYTAVVPPVRNAELGNLALDLLGLPAIPTSRIGVDQDLDVD
jgi:hypothetical protein